MKAKAGGSAVSAERRVKDGLEAIRTGLAPYVEKRMRARHGAERRQYASRGARDDEAAGSLDARALPKTVLVHEICDAGRPAADKVRMPAARTPLHPT